MIDRLKPYPRMKDSGVPWLGQVPEHWEIKRGKTVFNVIDIRSEDGREELLTVSSERGIVPRSTIKVTMFKAESYKGYKLCWPEDLVINSLWAWARGLGVTRFHGIVSSAYSIYRVKAKNKIYSGYIHELVRSQPFQWELQVRSKGIWISRLQLTDEAFLDAPFPLPPFNEQKNIVKFIEYMDSKIWRYLKGKQNYIKLLEEQKQTIIHQAVTRGLDHNVRLKPSGVEWLGDVPEHWLQTRLKNVATIQTGITLGKNYRGKRTIEYPYLRVANVQNGRLDLKNIKYIATTKSEANSALLRFGDVLMTEGGDIDKLGRGCVWRDEIQGCCHQNHVFAVRCNQEILLPEFLVALITSRHGRNYFQLTAKKTTNLASTNSTVIGSFPIIFPSISEQKSVTKVLEQITSGLEQAITQALNEISLLREYRTHLIADIVTGKLDVLEAAARLPQAPLEPADEVENLLEEENDPDIDQTDETKEVSV